MATDKQEYDRYAKSLWIKVYQDLITKQGCKTAKHHADTAVADYMSSIHGQSVVKENFTIQKEATLKDLHETKYNGKPLELLIDGKPVSEILKDSVVKKNFTTDSVSENKQTDTQTNLSSTDNTQFDWQDLLSVDEYVNLVKKHAYTIDVTKKLNKLIYKKLKPLLSNVQNLHNGTFVEVPFKIDDLGEVVTEYSEYELLTICSYCDRNNIDQTSIKRIWLEMKPEDE